MAGANVTCNGANRAASYSGHVVLMAIMVMIIESHVGYAMRFSGAEQISKYILGSFHSSRATKLAAKATKVAAGKLKVRNVARCFSVVALSPHFCTGYRPDGHCIVCVQRLSFRNSSL